MSAKSLMKDIYLHFIGIYLCVEIFMIRWISYEHDKDYPHGFHRALSEEVRASKSLLVCWPILTLANYWILVLDS